MENKIKLFFAFLKMLSLVIRCPIGFLSYLFMIIFVQCIRKIRIETHINSVKLIKSMPSLFN